MGLQLDRGRLRVVRRVRRLGQLPEERALGQTCMGFTTWPPGMTIWKSSCKVLQLRVFICSSVFTVQ